MREDERMIFRILFCIILIAYLPFLILAATPSSSTCHPHQRDALLRFINSLSITPPIGDDDFCGNASYPKTASWREDQDCSSWEGVSCDNSTGDIVGLDLACTRLQGQIVSSSPLFSLRYLRSISLAGNDLLGSIVPSEIGVFAQLTCLNLSYSGISGILPTEISQLSRLVSLDLSYNFGLEMEDQTMRMLIQNLTQMEELNLGYVNMSTVTPISFMNLSSSLISLELFDCSLGGKFQEYIFGLPNLQMIDLSGNDPLTGTLPESKWSPRLDYLSLWGCSFTGALPNSIGNLSRLTLLELSGNNFTGAVPYSIGNLSRLTLLELSGNNFTGAVPYSIGNLSRLTLLELSGNKFTGAIPYSIGNLSRLTHLELWENKFNGAIPYSIGNLSRLTFLDLSGNNFSGAIPYSIGNLSRLTLLNLSGNNFTGAIPYSIGNLSRLTLLDLSENNFTGAIPYSIGNLSRLTILALTENNFTGAIPYSIGNLSRLTLLDLSENNFIGAIPYSIGNLCRLTLLYLSGNNFTGAIPNSIGNLSRLTLLYLSENNFTGAIPYSIGNLSQLTFLYLSENNFNGLTISGEDANHEFSLSKIQELNMENCNLSEFPSFLTRSKELRILDLSENKIQEIPSWLWSIGIDRLEELYLRDNSIKGSIPRSICQLTSLSSIYLHGNKLTGVIPQCLSNLTDLQYLFLSKNSLSGTLPPSLANCTSLMSLDVSYNSIGGAPPTSWLSTSSIDDIDLSHNKFEGPLPLPSYATTSYLVSDNQFSGEISSLICNATNLYILDLSNNSLTGTLPDCLKNVTTGIAVLNLRLNELRGQIPEIFHEGSNLNSFDISRNQFEGPLPRSLSHCKNLVALDVGSNKITDSFPTWLGDLPLKVLSLRSNNFHGNVSKYVVTQTFSEVRVLDLSNNRFEGNISDEFIGEMLGMARDNIYDFPDSYMASKNETWIYFSVMIDLKGTEIEMVKINVQFAVLDLSSNRFQGEIPKSIGLLKSLKELNLSHNGFTGMIPPSIGNLTNLEGLDLSSNYLFGEIPKELVKLTYLGALDLSRNNLTGPIPLGGHFNTFPDNSFEGNPELCGIPLTRSCGQGHKEAQPPSEGKDDGEEEEGGGWLEWKYMALGFGSGMGMGISLGYMVLEIGRPLWLVRMVIRMEASHGKRSKRKGALRRRNGGR